MNFKYDVVDPILQLVELLTPKTVNGPHDIGVVEVIISCFVETTLVSDESSVCAFMRD